MVGVSILTEACNGTTKAKPASSHWIYQKKTGSWIVQQPAWDQKPCSREEVGEPTPKVLNTPEWMTSCKMQQNSGRKLMRMQVLSWRGTGVPWYSEGVFLPGSWMVPAGKVTQRGDWWNAEVVSSANCLVMWHTVKLSISTERSSSQEKYSTIYQVRGSRKLLLPAWKTLGLVWTFQTGCSQPQNQKSNFHLQNHNAFRGIWKRYVMAR